MTYTFPSVPPINLTATARNMDFKNKKGKMIGKLEGQYFRKIVEESKHLMRIYDGWGIDREVLNQLPKDTVIQVLDKETDVLYETTREMYKEYGIKKDFGHEIQFFLPRKHFIQPLKKDLDLFESL